MDKKGRVIIIQRTWPWTFILATVVQLTIAIALFSDPAATQRMLIISGMDIFPRQFGLSPMELRYLILISALLSVTALFREDRLNRWVTVALLMPQVALLLVTFYANAIVLLQGEYLRDAVPQQVSRWAAWAGLAWHLYGALTQPCAIIERYVLHWHRGFDEAERLLVILQGKAERSSGGHGSP